MRVLAVDKKEKSLNFGRGDHGDGREGWNQATYII